MVPDAWVGDSLGSWLVEGFTLGACVGRLEGLSLGFGDKLGTALGESVAICGGAIWTIVGRPDGLLLGNTLAEGMVPAAWVGDSLGSWLVEGFTLGACVGRLDGMLLGFGDKLGTTLGGSVVGRADGLLLGKTLAEGMLNGFLLGTSLGEVLALMVGEVLGPTLGESLAS